jgi:hypothetical protein
MFPRLAEQYRALIQDLVLSLQALAESMRQQGLVATCYVCRDDFDGQGASFVADLGDGHLVRFLVSTFGISWVSPGTAMSLSSLRGPMPFRSCIGWPASCRQAPWSLVCPWRMRPKGLAQHPERCWAISHLGFCLGPQD